MKAKERIAASHRLIVLSFNVRSGIVEMTDNRMARVSIALFLVALNTLMLEILLIRVFDTILLPNIGYMVITCAMFGLGGAGIYTTLFPPSEDQDGRVRLAVSIVVLAASVLLLRPLLNAIPPLYREISPTALRYAVAGALLYLTIVQPFFLAGLTYSYLFTAYPSRINSLYFWDLSGAAVGCVIFLPFIRDLGPGGLMIVASGVLLVASILLLGRRPWARVLWAPAMVLVALPFLRAEGYYEFNEIQNKRGVRSARASGLVEWSEWDPISKIDVVNLLTDEGEGDERAVRRKHVAYDGGSQSTHIFPFDGDYTALRASVLRPGGTEGHFWQRGVLASHYLRRDSGAEVLIIGSAGGQETKAALVFAPQHVDGIELVSAVVRIGKTRYAEYNGGIFNDPRVDNRVGEGRSFLRSTAKRYDIIQIFSNHTSSNIATGIGATTPVYLQTVEAYSEFFSHLTQSGILHVNHHFYPRMVTTAALAWAQLGRTDFQAHVAVFERQNMVETLPTMLVKMSPWTRAELEELDAFFGLDGPGTTPWRLVVDPLDRTTSFLPPEFFAGRLPDSLRDRVPYRVWPATDDRPYFSNIQKRLERVDIDPERLVNMSMASSLNGRMTWFAGEYTVFVVVGATGLVCSLALVLIPLLLSSAGRAAWRNKPSWMAYFACLGAAFIIVELVLVQLFMKPIGFPLYTFAVVLFTLLLSAGAGSFAGGRLAVRPGGRWALPFLGILIAGSAFTLSYPLVFQHLMGLPLWGRIFTAALVMFPLGFFMGMPFPLGVLSLEGKPRGAVAWAWGMNALFTVIGGVACGILSIELGFRATLLIGLGTYAFAFMLIGRLMMWRASGSIEAPAPS
jgi:spermidine synthase